MKPFAFDYYAPDSLEEALALLADHGSEADPLAGGQDLIPAMNFCVVQSALLVEMAALLARIKK